MCVVSMIGDFYGDRWKQPPYQQIIYTPDQVSRAEYDALKREVEVMKALLEKAKLYDEKNNEPDCEIDDKMKFLKRVAESVGIDLDDVLKKKKGNGRTKGKV